MIKHIVSVSGGKDSQAVLDIVLRRCPPESVEAIFCDTGNEHEAVYAHLEYLEKFYGIKIYRLKADFSEHIAGKRLFISRDQRNKRVYDIVPVFDTSGKPVPKRDGRGNIVTHAVTRKGVTTIEPVQKERKIGSGRRKRWTNKAKRRALSVLHPTGNPFLDLCLWKGRFPSRKAQFCTQELKVAMAVEFQLKMIDEGHQVISWQGVRRDESLNRLNAKKIERVGGGLWIFRPIVHWMAQQVFALSELRGTKNNPLYTQGMGRVGCMPCINANKAELKQIALRFPDHIARISEWEQLVGMASKRSAATFIPAPGITPDQAADHGIYSVIKWAKTSRGGRQFDLLADLEESGCSSSYGLCE